MTMHIDRMTRIVEELNSLLVRARVDRVYQGGEGGVYLVCSRDRARRILLISPDRKLPRMHLVSIKPASAPSSHPFVLNLRSRLSGARILGARILNEDRIADIMFVKNGRDYHLLAELTGSSANVVFTDSELEIISVYYPVPPADHSPRTLLPGARYVPPVRKLHALPGKNETERDDESLGPNEAAEVYFGKLTASHGTGLLRSEIVSHLKKALTRIGRRIGGISSDLATAGRADEFKHAGDLLLANLGSIRPGMERAELRTYDGDAVSVSLDPKLSPSGNAERYFRKYKKAKSGLRVISARLADARNVQAYLESLMKSVEHAPDAEKLEAIRSELQARGYWGARTIRKAKAAPAQTSQRYRTVLFQGWEILVGKSASGNDYITTKLARPDDLWLHAEGMPGSHVLVRNPGKTEIPADVLLAAAGLAAGHSRGRLSGKVPVAYTSARYVRKPKGAKPGLVTLSERKTIMVAPAAGEPE